jgi:hypothetical protein
MTDGPLAIGPMANGPQMTDVFEIDPPAITQCPAKQFQYFLGCLFFSLWRCEAD